ncbi:MAG: sugar phosphate isomerase/epimerase family protein, partial [Armatimonadota bacterium]
MPLKYAAFTVMMPEFTPAEAVSLLKSLGYDGIEWRVHSVPTQFPAKPDFWRSNRATIDVETIVDTADTIRRMTEDAGLEIIGLGTYLSYKLLDDVERCMAAARAMGSPSIRVSPPGYDGSVNYNDLFEEAVDGYSQVENLAREYGVRANIEIHHGKICPSASLAYR